MIAAAEPFADATAAARWLAAAGEEALAEQLAVLERALHAFRVVTADPYAEPLARERLLVARLGFGEGEEVAHGRWSQARELLPPPASRKRSKVLEPQARLAGVLGGRVPLLVCEELALRARRDLDAGREPSCRAAAADRLRGGAGRARRRRAPGGTGRRVASAAARCGGHGARRSAVS